MKLYGLFEYSYDYYEWEDLRVASYQKSKLEEYYKSLCSVHSITYIPEVHKEYSENERCHFFIKEIELV